MSVVGQPLTIAELIEYMEQHKRGTIDDEVIGRLRQVAEQQAMQPMAERMGDMLLAHAIQPDGVMVVQAKMNRGEAIAFFKAQITQADQHKLAHHDRNLEHRTMMQWHYGKCELYDLMDAIYGPGESC